MKNFLLFCAIFLFIISLSCRKGKELKTNAGFRYILYTESSGPKAKVGDYVTIVMVYKNDKDSVLFDSRNNGAPLRFRLEKIPFHGSFEEGLTALGEKDSATFFVPADSLYEYLYKNRGGELAQNKSGFTPGTFLKFDIRLDKIQSDIQAEEEMQMQLSEAEKKEHADLNKYLESKKISINPDSSGYIIIMHSTGNGDAVDSGKIITVEYEGRLLNDSVYDGTKDSGSPYKFISGSHRVIKGWELAMKNLHGGDAFTLILPSKLAFGEEGIQDPSTGSFIVPPYTPLVFDIKIISVEDAPAVSSK